MREGIEIRLNFRSRRLVTLIDRHRQQFPCVAEANRQLIEYHDDLFKGGTLLAQRLCAIRVIPDIRLFQFTLNFYEAFRLPFIVKDTSSTRTCVRSGRQWFV